jgi:hypothetical protein
MKVAVNCIRCGAGSDEATIAVDVDDGLIRCGGCGAEYTAADVRAVLASWGPVLAWVESHPALTPAPQGQDTPPADPIADRLPGAVRGGKSA